MKDWRHSWFQIFSFIALVAAMGAEIACGGGFEFRVAQRPDCIVVEDGGKPVMKYLFAPAQYKPYVSELRTTTGFNVLRDAPKDHHHHHGLMYGIKVNGVNFWEEISGSGVQKVVSTAWAEESGRNAPCAVITQELHWLAAPDAFLPEDRVVPLLKERRKLTLSVDRAAGETRLIWHARFEVPGKTNVVSLTGSSYHGLGARFIAALDSASNHVTDSGSPDLSGTKQDVSRHPWEAVVFNAGDTKATFAILGFPQNARKEPMFFGMRHPFTYISATQGLDKEPLVYKSGDVFEISYQVLLYPEAKSSQWLSERWNRFARGE